MKGDTRKRRTIQEYKAIRGWSVTAFCHFEQSEKSRKTFAKNKYICQYLTMNYRYYYVYILSNKTNSVLYVGVTNNLIKRVYEHKEKFVDGFTKRYSINKLVYYEMVNDVYSAITREKQIKGYSREKKESLIYSFNPNWDDLYEVIATSY